MAKAVLCPVCGGAGQLPSSFLPDRSTIATPATKLCHGCCGKGWVEVADCPQNYYVPKTTA